MHKILFILTIIILLPIHALADCQLNSDSTGCVSYNGCHFVPPTYITTPECARCTPGTYNNNDLNDTNDCTNCPTSYSPTTDPGKIPDTAAQAPGQSECPWKCNTHYYKSGDNCALCPSNSTTDGTGSLSIDDCKCADGKYMGGGVCRTCPANATTGCPRGTTANDIQCQPGYTKIISPDGVVTCTQCPPNSTLNGTNCECNIGYYANGNICTQCPFGTTTVATGATSLGDCQMNNTTRFCDANGENCMNLIPSGITINTQ